MIEIYIFREHNSKSSVNSLIWIPGTPDSGLFYVSFFCWEGGCKNVFYYAKINWILNIEFALISKWDLHSLNQQIFVLCIESRSGSQITYIVQISAKYEITEC